MASSNQTDPEKGLESRFYPQLEMMNYKPSSSESEMGQDRDLEKLDNLDNLDNLDKEETEPEAAVPEIEAEEEDPNIVDWDGPDDPANPKNWSSFRRWLIVVCMGLMTFIVTFASSVFSTATQVTAKEFHVSEEVMVLGTSLFVLG